MAEVSDIQSTPPPTNPDVPSSKVRFLNQDTYTTPNGHHVSDDESHDTRPSMANSNAIVNGSFVNGNDGSESLLPEFPLSTSDIHASPKQTEGPAVTLLQLSFDDNFLENGSYDDDDEDESDDFVDQLELARIRHLSTIVEGAREDSNSSTDDEDSDYIRLDIMREGMVNSASQYGNKERVEEEIKVEPASESVEDHTCTEVHADSANSRTPDQTSTSVVLNDSLTLQVNPPIELANGIMHEVEDNDVNLPDHDTDLGVANEARTVCSPDGFLALLSDALAAPPVLDSNQGQQDGVDQLQITSPLSDSWPMSKDEVK